MHSPWVLLLATTLLAALATNAYPAPHVDISVSISIDEKHNPERVKDHMPSYAKERDQHALNDDYEIDYDCSDKPDGNYPHPYDCTRFISCSGGVASARDCASCNVDPVRCPEGRTVSNNTVEYV